MKPLRKIVGYALVAAPFVGLGVWTWHQKGGVDLILTFALVMAVAGCIALGLWLKAD